MNEDELWSAIDTQRERLAVFLDGLSAEEWARPSLCAGWLVRDVAAHLTYAQSTLPEILGELLRHPAGTQRFTRDAAIRRAQRPTAELIASIRGMVGSRKHISVVTPWETLTDILVHSQDIAVPIGRPFDLDRAAATAAAERVWGRGYPFWARRRFAGRRLVATDAAFDSAATSRGASGSGGEPGPLRGDRIERPIGDLLLMLTGRPDPAA